ncbi:DUF6243 family protein [Streptomyces sp. WA6-1-16]|uniref:DUF6243 family protein n=1 Tax=Streptomyces TaxID=1883 RepID=UPI000A23992C|nr:MULTISPECIES: DUF6243 family protein [unclassified Streptomyces]OSC73821.1 hypothetical protein B5180_16220 [Streptomyces sp. BF-3]PVC84373.1 hypothetical protein DBP20_18520 [Streptomyces sp. CS131]UCA54146.1 DUF6243 family protein [Streptomyces sp. WA6-1-16]
MTDSKNINNPVGMGGGQRKRQSRAERQNNGPHRNLDRKNAADQKAELVRKMREKTGASGGGGQTDTPEGSGQAGATEGAGQAGTAEGAGQTDTAAG